MRRISTSSRMLKDADVRDAGDVVDYFVTRFLRVELEAGDRDALVDFFRSELGGDRVESSDEQTESALRSLLVSRAKHGGVSVGVARSGQPDSSGKLE